MLKLRMLEAVFYRTSSGREPVREWLRSLPRDDRRIIGGDIRVVQYQWPLGRPRVDHLRDGLWEVRSNPNNREARMLFAVAAGRMVLLHAFIKKTRATPATEIELAGRRWTHWQGQEEDDGDE